MSPASLRREARASLSLATPIIAAQLSIMGMGAVDTIMAGRYSGAALAAVAVGTSLWFLPFVFFMGLFMAVSPLVAHRVGARETEGSIGDYARSSMLLAAALGLVWMLALKLTYPRLVGLLGLPAQTEAYALGYLAAVSWSAPVFALGFVLRSTAEGRGASRAVMMAGLVAFPFNALFDWLLMYGRWGFPELGPTGCGIATGLSGVVMLLAYALAFRRWRSLRGMRILRPQRPRLEFASAAETLRLGLPIALILTAEASLFQISALLMAHFGETAVAAHQIAINFAAVCFMVPMSLGMATTVRVGQAAGAGDAAQARLRGCVGIALGLVSALFSAGSMLLFPEAIVAIYTDVPEVAALAVNFLGLAALFQVFDCLQATSSGALRGLKDTRAPMLITVASYWLVGMGVAIGAAFFAGYGPRGLWWGLVAGLAAAAIGLNLRFLRRSAMSAPRSPRFSRARRP